MPCLVRVVAEQAAATTNRRLAARLRFARFPYRRTIEEFDFAFQPSVDRKVIEDLASLRFIGEGRSLAFLGQPGRGKTHLAVATKAVEPGYRGFFTTADEMVVALARARAEGTWVTRLRHYTAPTVLVVDDVGLLPMARDAAGSFFHVINSRYEHASPTLVTTNRSLPAWGELFGDDVVASGRHLGPHLARPSWSTSKASHGGCASTRPWPRPPAGPTRPRKEVAASLSPRRAPRPPDAGPGDRGAQLPLIARRDI